MSKVNELGLWLETLLGEEGLAEIGGELIYIEDESVKLLWDEATFSQVAKLPTVTTLRLQTSVEKSGEKA